MEEEVQKTASEVKKAWPVVMSWVGGTSAIIGLIAGIAGGVNWYQNRHKQQAELQNKIALAQTQTNQGEYQAAVQSYAEILKTDSLCDPARDQQLNTAMLWVENFRVAARDDQGSAQLAGPELDQIMSILDAALARTKGSQAADVQAHIGWAHWLNQHIAQREFGPAAEQNLRAAVANDPSNVYANAMLGNWMLQNGQSLTEASQHFDTAVTTGKARPLVRQMQLGALIDLDKAGARAQLVKVANDMRKSNEPLANQDRSRILSFCFNPSLTDHQELVESLSAVPADDAWKTYLWLDNQSGQDETQNLAHDFIRANLLEIEGKQQEALQAYRLLQKQLKDHPGSIASAVNAAVARLTRA